MINIPGRGSKEERIRIHLQATKGIQCQEGTIDIYRESENNEHMSDKRSGVRMARCMCDVHVTYA